MTNTIIVLETAGVLKYNAGTAIDTFENVSRINSGFGNGFEAQVGTKTDTLILNPWFANCPEKRDTILSKPDYQHVKNILLAPTSGIPEVPAGSDEHFHDKQVSIIPKEIVDLARQGTGVVAHYGFYLAALYFWQTQKQVTIYGIDPTLTCHYWEDYAYPPLHGLDAEKTIALEWAHLKTLPGVEFLEDTLRTENNEQ
ncbi:MAG: glycosyltransferase family 29 protein [Planctomycetia bacterium]|nr:glycosyltransferase family 29 protein [Planctomycetia bacterium]